MSTVDNDRPPYVVFERQPVEDRTATIANGHYSTKDVDMAIITRPGARDNLVKEAKVWLNEIKEKCRLGQLPAQWYPAFAASYKAFTDGEELPTEGTPLKTWPVASPATQKDLIHAGIRTVEDLAKLPDNELQAIGIGAVALKQKAIAWLEAAAGPGKVVEQMTALQTQLSDQAKQISELIALTRQQAQELERYAPKTAKA